MSFEASEESEDGFSVACHWIESLCVSLNLLYDVQHHPHRAKSPKPASPLAFTETVAFTFLAKRAASAFQWA